ncbi:MAG: nucleotide exchange factor GrpE [Ruminococcaceae bacterium]|nr:nucleotide exchange factor GrpE [Oscillospiraceae bacterium]
MDEEIKQDVENQTEVIEDISENTTENAECENAVEEDKKTEKSFLGKKKKNAEAEKLQKEITELKSEIDEHKDKYARLAAEYDNYRKRTAKEIDMRYTDAKADVWKSIISVIDDFERVINTEIPEECHNFKDGVNLIYKKLTEMMAAAGIEEIKALNEQFDPELHNAVMHIDSEEAGENEVVEVFMKGYKLGDKVIRCSMVKVAN